MKTTTERLFGSLLMGALLLAQMPLTSFEQQPQLTPRPNTTLLDDRAERGFKAIFNGTDLTGWDGNPKLWSVKDGSIVGQTTVENPASGNTFLIWTNGTVSDFEFRCSFK